MKRILSPSHILLTCFIIVEWIYGLEHHKFLSLIGVQVLGFFLFVNVWGLFSKKASWHKD